MRGLFVKDLLLIKNQKRTLPIMLVCGFIMAASNQASITIVYLAILGTMLSAGTISTDEAGNGYSFLFTLPVTRTSYVREKYLFSVLFCLASTVLGFLISIAAAMAKGTPALAFMDDYLSFAAGALFAVAVMLGSMIPVRLKYGSERGTLVLYSVFGGIAVFALLMKRADFLLPAGIRGMFSSIAKAAAGTDGKVALPCLMALSLLILCISEQVSERIVMNREY